MIDKEIKINLSANGGRNIWVRIGILIDDFNLKPFPSAHIVYNSDSILFIGSEKTPPPPHLIKPQQTKPDLELPDFTLLPGLIEAHAHLFLEGGELDIEKRKTFFQKSPQEMLQSAQNRLKKFIEIGIIGVRDAGDKFRVGLALSKQYKDVASTFTVENQKEKYLPYIDSPGAAINHKSGYGSFMAEPVENYKSLQECVKARIDSGAERIKLIATDIIDFEAGRVTKEPQMTAEEISEIVKIAKQFGKQTFAHAPGDDGIERAIQGEVDSIEHGFFIRDDQLAKMRDKNIAWCPTFTPIQKQIDYADKLWVNKNDISSRNVLSALKRILDQHSSNLLKAFQMGVTIIAGSDAGSYGVVHGFGLFNELELMERAGLSPLAVINAATGNSSNRLAFKELFGQIRPGYRSRFILTKHSPLEGLSNLRKEKYVMIDGSVKKRIHNIPATGF